MRIREHRWRAILGAAVVVLAGVCGTLGDARAGGDEPPVSARALNDRALELLRAGRNEEARALAEQVIGLEAVDPTARAEALFFLATVRVRAKHRNGAEEAMGRLDEVMKQVDETHWVHREAVILRGVLNGLSQADAVKAADNAVAARLMQPPPAGEIGDIGQAVWNLRYANSVKAWARAVEWGERILVLPAASDPALRGDTLMHLYFAQRKLGKDEDAARSASQFTELEGSLPAGSTLGLEMALARRSLGDEAALPQRDTFAPGPDNYWKRVTPGTVGLDANILHEHEEMCRRSGADGVLVAHRGAIVSEWYSPLYAEPMYTMSSAKAITALVAGLLVADGKLKVDDLVGHSIPEWNEGMAQRATVRHLLTMTAGIPRAPAGGMASPEAAGHGLNEVVRALRPSWEPGTKWTYSNDSAQLVSPVLERAAGMPLHQYAKERLFDPMGLRGTAFARDNAGSTKTFADAATTLREMAKFGELVRLRGRWGDQQIITEAWLDEMLTSCPLRPDYGYLWWLSNEPVRCVSMQGYLNTSVWVFPDLDLVVARTQRKPYLHATEEYEPRKMMEMMVKAVGDRR